MDRLNIGGITYRFGRSEFESYDKGIQREWVMTNGLGSYSSSTIIDSPKRKHHGLLIASLHPPVKRYLILSKLLETITIGDNDYPLHSSKYKTSVTEGFKHLSHFYYDTFPIYTYQISDVTVKKRVLLRRMHNSVSIKYTIETGSQEAILTFSPCFNFRDHGGASSKDDHHFRLNAMDNQLILQPDAEKVTIAYRISDGCLRKSDSLYDEDNYLDFEFETGMEGIDTHYHPFQHKLIIKPYTTKEFYIQCEVVDFNDSYDFNTSIDNQDSSLDTSAKDLPVSPLAIYDKLVYTEHLDYMHKLIETSGADQDLKKRLTLSADQFICYRQSTGLQTVLAGLPWFTDWGRDTMIALCGLTLSTKRFETAKEILKSFALYEKNGLLPNVFPDQGQNPMYNSVDAALWYFQALYQYYTRTHDIDLVKDLYPVLHKIILSFIEGTDFSIHMDEDGLIHAGSGIDQVTWMDVRIKGVCVTPRHGKPVEISALWYNALMIMDQFSSLLNQPKNIHRTTYKDLSNLVQQSFIEKFWKEDLGYLIDVVDEDDSALRPNQLYALSLAFGMLDLKQSKSIVDTLYKELYTSYGLRSLSTDHPDFKALYSGQLVQRDYAYHQGTVWGFLLGGFISAYQKVYKNAPRSLIYEKFIDPIRDHLQDGCIGGFSEIFDASAPHHQRGCYNQAWSIGETLRAIEELEV